MVSDATHDFSPTRCMCSFEFGEASSTMHGLLYAGPIYLPLDVKTISLWGPVSYLEVFIERVYKNVLIRTNVHVFI